MKFYRRIMPPTPFDSLARSGFERFVLSRLENSKRSSAATWLLALVCVAGFYFAIVPKDHVFAAIGFGLLAFAQILEHYAGIAYYRILERAKAMIPEPEKLTKEPDELDV